ncbi:MAG: M23 family peptidase, partial [bacterium]
MELKLLQRLLAIVYLIHFFSSIGFAQDYLWPTDASQYLTSSFAEYRPGHFHAGIDIKTWGRIGHKVFAIRDGYIMRIGVSPFGYGKVLYQKLDTGVIAVYAHLS